MPVGAGKHKLTYEDYRKIPEDLQRHEVLDGVEVVSPAPSTRHQRVLRRLLVTLTLWADAGNRGEVLCAPLDVVLGPHDIVQPDLVFISAARASIVGPAGVQGAPDLVVEIVSPSSRRLDLIAKPVRYARGGLGAYWVVDPELDQIQVFSLRAGPPPELIRVAELWAHQGDRLEPAGFPGLEVALPTLFAP